MRAGVAGPLVALCVASCGFESAPVAPPTNLRAERGADGRVVVSWDRSRDDGGGSSLVHEYVVLRSTQRDGLYAPFAHRKVEGKRPSLVDTTEASWREHWYVVWAVPARERSTPTERGGQPSRSEPVGPASSSAGEPGRTAETPAGVRARAPDRDNGEHVELAWDPPRAPLAGTVILRGQRDGDMAPFPGGALGPGANAVTVTVPGPSPPTSYLFAVYAVPEHGDASPPAGVFARPRAALFDTKRWALLALIALAAFAMAFFVRRARRMGERMFIRRIPGIDALEEAIGRATEMGRPVLYVPGVEETLSTQTIATVLVLGHVAERVAKYGARLRVSVNFPMTLPLAQEAVKQGYLAAGRPDAYNPNDVQWISSEQFAFTAGTNGIILREKPATNIYLGRFYAESLILSETGFVNRAIQIAGTAEIPQLPFFVAACDYTLIGEELYAMSAYLSRQPALLGTLKGGDVVKLAAIAVLIVGSALGLADAWPGFAGFFAPAE